MKILISNDDGWQAPGIVALAAVVETFASIKVVAPDRNRSAASNSLTLMRPIRVTPQNSDWYSVDGTPVDCVNLALNGLFDWVPDMVVSGINAGPNLGDDVLYSGTVAAATEGYLHGIQSMAFSLTDTSSGFDAAAHVAADLIKRCYNTPLLQNNILSINIPHMTLPHTGSTDTVIYAATRLGRRGRSGEGSSHHMTDPRGEKIYWIGQVSEPIDSGEGTDFFAIKNDRVSITPISTDMTAHDHIASVVEVLNDTDPGGDAQ